MLKSISQYFNGLTGDAVCFVLGCGYNHCRYRGTGFELSGLGEVLCMSSQSNIQTESPEALTGISVPTQGEISP